MSRARLSQEYLSALRVSLDGQVVRSGLHLAVIHFERGLADGECVAIERRLRFRFPPDLRGLLHSALPLGGDADWKGDANWRTGFPDWRSWSDEQLRWRLDAPIDGICFDVEHSDFWMPMWGPKPARLTDALASAREHVAHAPKLTPVYGHRYLPDQPSSAGNPLFSVMQTSVMRWGDDLAGYFHQEFGVPEPPGWAVKPRRISFWDDLATKPPEWGGL